MKKIKFMDLDILVPKNIFTPRPESRLLVNVTLYALKSKDNDKQTARILDIGTGTGNIAISLTKFNKSCKLITLDIKPEALEIAKKNALLNGVSDRIEFRQGDIFNDLPKFQREKFDIIVSNPPYVARWEMATLSENVQNEPRVALDGGEDGLDFYRRICFITPQYLKPGGYLIMEIGYNQSHPIKKMLRENNFEDLEIFRDDAGIDRIIMAKLINKLDSKSTT